VRRLRSRLLSPTALGALLVLVIALASAREAWPGTVNWTPDGLFYQARVLQIRGETQQQALHHTIDGRPMQELVNLEFPNLHDLLPFQNPGFVRYAALSTHRRVLVPGLAAAIYPRFGLRSLQIVSLAGYVLACLVLFALLRRRFGPVTSTLVASGCALLAPFRFWSFHPLTDSWGIALEALCLLAAVLVLERGPRWLPAWVAAVAALSLTRDAAVVVVGGAALLALVERRRRPLWLALSGVAAALPAPLLFGSQAGDAAKYAVSHAGWWSNLRRTASADFRVDTFASHQRVVGLAIVIALAVLVLGPRLRIDARLRRFVIASGLVPAAVLLAGVAFWWVRFRGGPQVPAGLLFLAGLALLWLPLGPADALVRLARASSVACALYLALWPTPTGFRLELAFLPMVAVGLARALERWPAAEPVPALAERLEPA
jgi:hypothetical protein